MTILPSPIVVNVTLLIHTKDTATEIYTTELPMLQSRTYSVGDCSLLQRPVLRFRGVKF